MPFLVYATIYEPGETLNPDCGPAEVNCGVTTPAQSGVNTDITSLSNLNAITSTRGFVSELLFATASGTSITSTNLRVSGTSTLQGLSFETASGTDVSIAGNFIQTPLAQPRIVGGIPSSASPSINGSWVTKVQGQFAYLGTTKTGADYFSVIDITDPYTPRQISSISSINDIRDISIVGKYAYVVSTYAVISEQQLYIVDISNPAAPVVQGSLLLSSGMDTSIFRVQTVGKYAYITTGFHNSLLVVDVSNPSSPVLAGSVSSSLMSGASSIAISGTHAVVGGNVSDSLVVVDVSNPGNPQIVGSISTTSSLDGVRDIYISGKYAYAVGSSVNDTLTVVDISSSTNPVVVGSVQSSSLDAPFSVQVSGKYAYVAAGIRNALTVVDISSSTNPVVVGSVQDPTKLHSPRSVYISGKYAYMANVGSNGGFYVVDLGGVNTPVAHIGGLQSSNVSVTDNVVIGSNLYVGNALSVGMGGIRTDGLFMVTDANVFMPALLAPSSTSDVLCLQPDGRITHQASNCTVSSERFKHDIESWNEGLSTIMQLRPVLYKRNYDQVEELGLIAEEVDLVNKHFVIYESDSTSTPRSVDYERLVIPLISAVQAQQAQIDGLILAYAGVSSSEPGVTSEEELLYAANRPRTSALKYLMDKISTATFILKDFVAERVTAMVGIFHKVKVETGIEMTDQETGEVYCVEIRSGEFIKNSGMCGEESTNERQDEYGAFFETENVVEDVSIDVSETSDETQVVESFESVSTTSTSLVEMGDTTSTIEIEIESSEILIEDTSSVQTDT